MNPHLLGASALLASTLSAPVLADSWSCSYTQACKLGAECFDLTKIRSVTVLEKDNSTIIHTMEGRVETMIEIAAFDSARSFATSNDPSTALLLAMHQNGTLGLTIHYFTPDGFFSNTLLGTCTKDAP